MKKLILSAAMLLLAAAGAHAEKADANKPTKIDYDDLQIDDVKQIKTLIGNVVLTRGTLLMKSPKAVVTTDPEGYNFVVLTSTPGTLSTFRQKRDGAGDQWIEGEAERIEYSDKTDLVKLFSKARVRQLEGPRMTSEVNSEFISYDSRTEHFDVKNNVSGVSKPGAGRGTMVIQPTIRPAAPAASAPAASTPPATEK
ncbi:lipopolysaccharide transport periplasmic protein LptA [Duganella violaceipulchra]|uniref:Lipopolysaccharide export system protein LptA n=1 Tax=Duganella violaceipulchra TaxID=2849652 RepID=A0AA41L7X9_9BURK|nr:lipopolysaccharide transport periplasmic protein LptA [Duganella violaceicalia]MBV6321670.1 lipopolysaccharide transport periplasmic protein LptA [Duganella violaceicalia]MCP2008070.1 lipopolysaccharide export system protein LptA [Duganella violaceicalia]